MIESCMVLGLLGICSWEDVRKKEIGIYKVFFTGIAGMLLHIFRGNMSIYNILGGMLLGIILLLAGRISKGNIGCGDGLILMVTGILLGTAGNMQLFFYGLLFAGIWALILLVLFRKKKNYEIPFIPFLLVSYVGMLLWG